jgi:hypothetical protein
MPDSAPLPQVIHSDSDFVGLSDKDCVDYQDAVWELIRWLDANLCGAQAGRLKKVMGAVPPISEPEAPNPEPELAAWELVLKVLSEIIIVRPRGLAQVQYKEFRTLHEQAMRCVRRRLRKLRDDKARRDKAIEHVRERLQALPEAPLQPAGLEFQPGAIVYRGQREPLSGKPRQVLKALAQAPGRTLSLNDIMRTIWGNTVIGEEAVRRHIYTARKALRKAIQAAHVQDTRDPIPVVDRGTGQIAWRLDLP